MGIANAGLPLDCGDELVYERVQLRRLRPGLPLQMLEQFLVRGIELHAGRQPREILERRLESPPIDFKLWKSTRVESL